MYCLVNGCWYGKEMLGCKRKEKKTQNLRGKGREKGRKDNPGEK